MLRVEGSSIGFCVERVHVELGLFLLVPGVEGRLWDVVRGPPVEDGHLDQEAGQGGGRLRAGDGNLGPRACTLGRKMTMEAPDVSSTSLTFFPSFPSKAGTANCGTFRTVEQSSAMAPSYLKE